MKSAATLRDRSPAWRDGHAFALHVGAGAFYPRMLEAIAAARDEVLFEMYLFESGAAADRYLDVLAGAAERGVRVCVLLDALGSLALAARDVARLRQAGADLRWFNPLGLRHGWRNVHRNHRKLLCIDAAVAWVGGAGVCDEYLERPGVPAWLDLMLELRGPDVARWRELFAATWQGSGGAPLGSPRPVPAPDAERALGRVTLSAGGYGSLHAALLRHVRGARQRVWLCTAYFMPSWKLRSALRRAAARGLDVRLLLPGPITDHPPVRFAGRRFYARLLRHGVRIYEYQPAFLHAKALLCDDIASLGSANMDRWNLRFSHEANQELRYSRAVADLEGFFDRAFGQSVEWTRESWGGRAWWARWREWWWGVVDVWIERAARRWWA